ncbi:purine permease 4 [Actinidia rufa]|uniref:Purine permease 4 n=1 Tax=Actinidia rufa TaxID=165716 RepID=A0A7J0DVG9_9ERIC|nr:purine permease 4 [Actinidia rufa]
MGLHLGPVRRLPPPPASHIFPVQIHRQTPLHGLHFISISDVFYYWIAVGSEQSTLLRGDLVPPRVNFLSPTVVPVGVQSRLIRGNCQNQNQLPEPKLRRTADHELDTAGFVLERRQTSRADTWQVLYRVFFDDRSGFNVRALPSGDGEGVQEGGLLRDGGGDAAGDGGGRHRSGNSGDGGGWRGVLRYEEGELGGLRQGSRGVLVGGGGERGDVAAVLHGDRGDGVPDDVGDRRDMHDGVDGS